MTDLLLNVFAGLGFFFLGVQQMGKNLQRMTDGPFRVMVQKSSGSTILSAIWGIFAGLITQSGRTTSLILSSLIQGNILSAKAAVPIMLWANLGCTLIVFLTVIPIDLITLFLIGLTGFILAFKKPKKFLNPAGAILGVALLLFGLQMISGAAFQLTEYKWFNEYLNLTNQSLLPGLLIGFILTLLVQSHIGIILITITLAGNGFFDFDNALMILYGSLLGSSGITYLTSLHVRGTPRQIVLGQILFNIIGVSIFLLLFLIERYLPISLLSHLSHLWIPSLAGQLGAVVLLLNVFTALLLTVTRSHLYNYCKRRSPAGEAEVLSQPQYLRNELLNTPEAALLICDKEQLRLLKRLPDYLAIIRSQKDKAASHELEIQNNAFLSVASQIHTFQSKMASLLLPEEKTEALLNQQNRQELLNALEASCVLLCRNLYQSDLQDESRAFCLHIVEALEAQLLTAISAFSDDDPMEAELLSEITSDDGSIMESIRKDFLLNTDYLPSTERTRILNITRYFERAIWQLHRYARLLIKKSNPQL